MLFEATPPGTYAAVAGSTEPSIPDLDIWRPTQFMVRHYGNPATDAATEASMCADEFKDQGKIDGLRVWIRIMRAIEELQRPGDGEAVH